MTVEQIEDIMESFEECIDGFYYAVVNYSGVAEEIIKQLKDETNRKDI